MFGRLTDSSAKSMLCNYSQFAASPLLIAPRDTSNNRRTLQSSFHLHYWTRAILKMEYFSSILCVFFLVTLMLSQFSLLDSKGWVAVVISFCSLIVVQRSHVRQEKEQEKADMIEKLQQFQKAQRELGEMRAKKAASNDS